jgi:CHC2 zinc finger/Toprim-like
MLQTRDLFLLAAQYHRALPNRIREYLRGRGIPGEIINRRFLGWSGVRITIPVFNRKGICASFRFAKDPADTSDAPKMVSTRGSSVELYGWDVLRLRPKRVIICEGEFDRLVLEANGFDAVTSTGGAGTFRRECAREFEAIPEVNICFDRDDAGRAGALRVARMIPHAKIVELPTEVGEGGDVTDFFARLGKSHDDFLALLTNAKPVPAPEEPARLPRQKPNGDITKLREEAERLKREVPIADVVEYYVELRCAGKTCTGRCPFHHDRKPSFTIYPGQGTFHCFGCGAHGDALTFLQKVEGWSFRQALRMLPHFGSGDEPGVE